MSSPSHVRRCRKIFLAMLAASFLAACETPPSPSTPPSTPVKQLHQDESAAYERGFLAGRRYQARLDSNRPPLPCATPAPPPAPAPAAPSTATPASPPPPAAPQPSPLPAGSYAPSGPARPVALSGT
ncbi:MAG: hypothetical protein ACLPJJ_01725 [Acidocella sp.]|uniref:hypothetical protein n=1 Tax=Acidocella sp. TaxID=50710 RepID=UPI003FC8179F